MTWLLFQLPILIIIFVVAAKIGSYNENNDQYWKLKQFTLYQDLVNGNESTLIPHLWSIWNSDKTIIVRAEAMRALAACGENISTIIQNLRSCKDQDLVNFTLQRFSNLRTELQDTIVRSLGVLPNALSNLMTNKEKFIDTARAVMHATQEYGAPPINISKFGDDPVIMAEHLVVCYGGWTDSVINLAKQTKSVFPSDAEKLIHLICSASSAKYRMMQDKFMYGWNIMELTVPNTASLADCATAIEGFHPKLYIVAEMLLER